MGKFIIKKSESGCSFRLKAGNGEIIAVSQTYAAEAYCKKGIRSVAANAPIAALEDQTEEGYAQQKNPKFEVYTDKGGDFRFRLRAKNGAIIAASQGYASKPSCLNGVESVRKNASNAAVDYE